MSKFIPRFDDLTKQSGIMLLATAVVNISLLFFHMYMSRMLGPADFGILASFLSIYFIVALPVNTIQTVMAKYVSRLKTRQQLEKIGFLYLRFLKKLLPYGLLGLTVFVLGTGYLASFLRIPSRGPLILLGTLLFLSLILPTARGTLQGLQRFTHLGANMSLEGISRFLLSSSMVYLGMGVAGAVGGMGLAVLVALLGALVPLRFLFASRVSSPPKSPRDDLESGEVHAFFWLVGLSLLCFAFLANIDLIMVKHFFDPLRAGYYSVLSVIGRGFLSVGMAISLVLFPKVTEQHELKADAFSILTRSLLVSLLLFGLGILICFLSSRTVVMTVFGPEYQAVSPLLKLFAPAITPLGLTFILVNYNLARHRTGFIWALVAGAVVYTALLVLFHSSLKQVVYILGSCSVFTFLLSLGVTLFQERHLNRKEPSKEVLICGGE